MLYDQMPWLSYYADKLPRVNDQVRRFREMALSRTSARYNGGSTNKDLFYYLVRLPTSHQSPILV